MGIFITRKGAYLKRFQLPISIVIVVGIAFVLFYTVPILGYRIPALVLLMVVSLFALIFEILTVIIAAILSALIWNFFFIPPLFTFHIANGEDGLMLLMYLQLQSLHLKL